MGMKRHDSNDISVLPGSKPELDTTRGITISCHDVHAESTRLDDLATLALAIFCNVSEPWGVFRFCFVGCRTC